MKEEVAGSILVRHPLLVNLGNLGWLRVVFSRISELFSI